MKFSIASGSISSQKPAFFFLTLVKVHDSQAEDLFCHIFVFIYFFFSSALLIMSNLTRFSNRKNLAVIMMNVGGRASTIRFLEHNSATVRDIIMGLGRVIEQINAECRVQE